MFYQRPIFKEFFLLAFIVALLNYLGGTHHLYYRLAEFDSLMHFLAGAMVALAVIWFYFFSGFFAPPKRRLFNFFLISILGTLFIAVSWEIFELVAGIAVEKWQTYSFDTSLDFVMDFLGATAAFLYSYMKETNHLLKGEAPDNLPI